MCTNVQRNIQDWKTRRLLKFALKSGIFQIFHFSNGCIYFIIRILYNIIGLCWTILFQVTMCKKFDFKNKSDHGEFYRWNSYIPFVIIVAHLEYSISKKIILRLFLHNNVLRHIGIFQIFHLQGFPVHLSTKITKYSIRAKKYSSHGLIYICR